MEWLQSGRQLQVSVLGPVLFIIYIGNIDLGFNIFISKFADDTKIGSAVFSKGDKRSLQEALRKISDWSVKWEMPFNINKWQILQVKVKLGAYAEQVRGLGAYFRDIGPWARGGN